MRERFTRYNWIILIRPIAHQNEQSSAAAVLTGALIPSKTTCSSIFLGPIFMKIHPTESTLVLLPAICSWLFSTESTIYNIAK